MVSLPIDIVSREGKQKDDKHWEEDLEEPRDRMPLLEREIFPAQQLKLLQRHDCSRQNQNRE